MARRFGYASAIDGKLCHLWCTWWENVVGAQSGAAFVYDIRTGEQITKLHPEDAAAEDRFGISVAIHENVAIVGSLHANATGPMSGAAYLFDVTTGKQLHKIVGEDTVAGDEFGISVGISDATAIVGAHMHDTGMAYLFDVESGQQTGKLISEDADSGSLFGVAVALDGNTALVGARYDDEFGTAAGAAYLFDTSTQQQMHKLTAHDATNGDRFGMYVDVDGNTAIVGSRYDDDVKKSSGSAYLFDVDTGRERFKLVADDSEPNDHFGSAVSVSGNMAIVGAVNDATHTIFAGSTYVYDVNTGEQLIHILAEDGQFLDQFGHSVGLDDGIAVVGATQLLQSGSTELATGKGYVFDLRTVPEPCTALGTICAAMLMLGTCRRQICR